MALCGKRRAKTFAMFTLCHGASRATWTDGRHWHLPCIAWTLLRKFVWWISWSRPTRTCPQDWYLKSCKLFERNLDKYRIYLENLESPEKLRPNFWSLVERSVGCSGSDTDLFLQGLVRLDTMLFWESVSILPLCSQHFLLLSTTFTKSCKRYLRLVGGQTVCGDLGGHFVGFLFDRANNVGDSFTGGNALQRRITQSFLLNFLQLVFES